MLRVTLAHRAPTHPLVRVDHKDWPVTMAEKVRSATRAPKVIAVTPVQPSRVVMAMRANKDQMELPGRTRSARLDHRDCQDYKA